MPADSNLEPTREAFGMSFRDFVLSD